MTTFLKNYLPKIIKSGTLPPMYMNVKETLIFLKYEISRELMANNFDAEKTIFKKYKIKDKYVQKKIMEIK